MVISATSDGRWGGCGAGSRVERGVAGVDAREEDAAPAMQATVSANGTQVIERFMGRMYGANACGARYWTGLSHLEPAGLPGRGGVGPFALVPVSLNIGSRRLL